VRAKITGLGKYTLLHFLLGKTGRSCGILKRKEVNTLRYEKPRLVALSPAVSAIQGTLWGKKHPTQAEGSIYGTPAAYEADE
jgi:hypothetical protein